MKNILFILVSFILSIPSFSQQMEFEKGDTIHVFVSSGLNLRNAPNGEKLETLKYGAPLIIKAITTHLEVFEKRSGMWLRVKSSSGKEGYIFSGYTTHLQTPKMDTLMFECHEIDRALKWFLEVQESDKITGIGKRAKKSLQHGAMDDYSHQWETHASGNSFSTIMENGSVYRIKESYDLSLNDVINFLDLIIARVNKLACVQQEKMGMPHYIVHLDKFSDRIISTKNMADFKAFRFGSKIICGAYTQ